jgi:hypothetical protein
MSIIIPVFIVSACVSLIVACLEGIGQTLFGPSRKW